METRENIAAIEKLKTGIPGFDLITLGGLPKGRTTLIAGTAGSAKTVMAVQFLAEEIKAAGGGVFVTFEESPEDIRNNMVSLGWDIRAWEAQGRWRFVDASIDPDREEVFSGPFDFSALVARLEHAIQQAGASRVAMDSLGTVFTQYDDRSIVRRRLLPRFHHPRVRCHRDRQDPDGHGVFERRNPERRALPLFGIRGEP